MTNNLELPEVPDHHWEVIPYEISLWQYSYDNPYGLPKMTKSETACTLQLNHNTDQKVSKWEVDNPKARWYNSEPKQLWRTEVKPATAVYGICVTNKEFEANTGLHPEDRIKWLFNSVTTPEAIFETAQRLYKLYHANLAAAKKDQARFLEQEEHRAERSRLAKNVPNLIGTYPPKTLKETP